MKIELASRFEQSNRLYQQGASGPHFQGVSGVMLPQNQIQISSIQGNKLSIKGQVFRSRRFGFKSNFDLLAAQLTHTSNEQMIIIKLPTFYVKKFCFCPWHYSNQLLLLRRKKVANFSEQCSRCLWSVVGAYWNSCKWILLYSSTNSHLHKILFVSTPIQTRYFYFLVSGQPQ